MNKQETFPCVLWDESRYNYFNVTQEQYDFLQWVIKETTLQEFVIFEKAEFKEFKGDMNND